MMSRPRTPISPKPVTFDPSTYQGIPADQHSLDQINATLDDIALAHGQELKPASGMPDAGETRARFRQFQHSVHQLTPDEQTRVDGLNTQLRKIEAGQHPDPLPMRPDDYRKGAIWDPADTDSPENYPVKQLGDLLRQRQGN